MSNIITRDMWDFASGMIQTAADMSNFHGAHVDAIEAALAHGVPGVRDMAAFDVQCNADAILELASYDRGHAVAAWPNVMFLATKFVA